MKLLNELRSIIVDIFKGITSFSGSRIKLSFNFGMDNIQGCRNNIVSQGLARNFYFGSSMRIFQSYFFEGG
jgi:hypothetical protein